MSGLTAARLTMERDSETRVAIDAERRLRECEDRTAALVEALRFLWRRARLMKDGPAMFLIEHVLYCGCAEDQHRMSRKDQTAARAAMSSGAE